MPVKLQSTMNVGTDRIKSAIYGPSGIGKTSLCATAPNPVIFSAESGLLPLRKLNLPFSEIRTYQDLVDAYTWCATSKEAQQFQTICIDSASEIGEVVLRNEKLHTKDPRKAYGELAEKVVAIIKDFRDIPGKHVVVFFKEERQKDEGSGMILYQPSMPGQKLGPAIPYLFDEVFHYESGVDQTTQQAWRALRTQTSTQAVAKDRSGSLDVWEFPHLGQIFDKIAKG